MVSPLDPTKYLGTQQWYVPVALQNKKLRDPTTADVKNPTAGGNYKISTIWVNQMTNLPWMLTNVSGNIATWVALGGGSSNAVLGVNVDTFTAPGTNPVLPGMDGLITVTGGLVDNGTIGANVIRTDSLQDNGFTVEIQISGTALFGIRGVNGVSHFNDLKFTVDQDGFVDLKNFPTPGATNIGLTYNAGTGIFTVCAADGSALSTNNPGYVTLASKSNLGLLKTIAVTANQTFTDSNGASTIIGNLFGLTTGIVSVTYLPFFLYAVSNDNENAISFMISRFPNSAFSPVSSKIGTPGNAVADTQGSFFALTNITTTSYDGNPCLSLGSFRMFFVASDNWNVLPFDVFDGLGHFQEGMQFSAIRSQFGAATGKFFKNNTGTAPDDADGAFGYYVDAKQNRVFFTLAFPSIDSPGGVGAVSAILALPYVRQEGASLGTGVTGNGTTYKVFAMGAAPTTNSAIMTATAPLLNTDFPTANDLSLNGVFNISFS